MQSDLDVKQILSLTPEQLAELDTETLETYRALLEFESQSDYITQMSLKILINSLYGALANKHFLLANPDLAAAITATGRFFIQFTSNEVEKALQALLPNSNPYVLYGDTDSVAGDSKIIVNGEKISIAEYFDRINQPVEITPSGNEVKSTNDDTITFDGEKLVNSTINYVMRHKVEKRMFKIKVTNQEDKEVIVTEDHSIKVVRDQELIDVKPSDIIKNDKLVMLVGLNGFTYVTKFKIEDLGIIEDYVYDIEVADTHCFFANDILVHNSFYYYLDPFVERKFGGTEDINDIEKVTQWCDNFEIKIVQPIIAKSIEKFGKILNIYDTNQIGVAREIIADAAVFVAKKKYFARARSMEDVTFDIDDPYIKVMGLEIARSSTPPWVKEKLEESIEVILDTNEQGVRSWRDKTRLEFTSQDIESICMTAGISNLDYNIHDKGIPQGSKSALAHNIWVKQQGLENEIPLLTAGEKYKRCYLKTPNRFGSEIISFSSDKIAKIIEQDGIFDYSKNFEIQFERPLERMIGPLGYRIDDNPAFGDLDAW